MSESKIADRIAKATLEVGAFTADKTNKEQGYSYISADMVLERGGQALAKQGVSIIPQVTDATITAVAREGKAPRLDALIKMHMIVTCENEVVTADWYGCGSDYATPDKALYKAITSGHKYFLMKLLNISVGNIDSEHEEGEKPASQPAKPTENKPAVINPVMTLQEAEAVTNSQGVPYGELAPDTLAHMANQLVKSLKNDMLAEERAEKERKLTACKVILAHKETTSQ